MRINGNLVLNADATGEIQNAFVERIGASPAFNSAEKGRLYFNTSTALYYFNDGAAWVPFATGGNAAALQSEVDNVETALGAVVNANGTFNGTAAFSGIPIIANAASVTDALNLIAAAAFGHELLAELGDVALGSLTNGQYLKYSSATGKWTNERLVLADVTDVTASAAEVNKLTGATFSTTEVNYVTGVTSAIQTQLDNKQALDAGLTALAVFNTNGIVVQTADNVFSGRTLQYPAQGLTITNPAGTIGDPTFALANDIQAVEGLTGNGYAIRTGTDTWTLRAITGQSGRIVVTAGDGQATNTDVDLAVLADAGTGTFLKLTRDTYGRVAGTTAVTTADITALADSSYVNVGGDTMSGTLTFSSGTVTGLPVPVNATDAANKAYVDATAAALTVHNAVEAATTAALAAVYSNGASGVGATLTNSGAQVAFSLDGYATPTGARVLVKDQAATVQNGIYTVTTVGAAGVNWVLTRATDADNSSPGELAAGVFVFVTEGTVNGKSGWVETAIGTGVAESIVIGTNPVVYTQFSGAGTYHAGTGLDLTGTVFSVLLGAGIADLPTGEVGIDLFSTSTGGLILTDTGSARSASATSKLQLLLPASGGLIQDVTGLYVPAAGIVNSMILNNTNGLNADSGTGTLALGQTLLVQGNAPQGINTSVTGQTITVTAADASTSQKGVARFDSGDFATTTGIVSIKALGVDNAQLANDHVTVTGTTGSDAVALGESFAIIGGVTGEVSTVMGANSLAVSVRDADYSLKGVASFAAADFTVTTGAVAIIAKNLDSLTDVVITGATGGDTLVNNGTSFVNRKTYFLYSSTGPATSHIVPHNLGQKYCNVTIVDATDEVVIPQSIMFDSVGQLTVTFTSSINCKVVVMGVNVGA